MKRQKVIITLADGSVLTYEGPAQFDTGAKQKVVKVQFTRPADDAPVDPTDEAVRAFGKMIDGIRRGKP